MLFLSMGSLLCMRRATLPCMRRSCIGCCLRCPLLGVAMKREDPGGAPSGWLASHPRAALAMHLGCTTCHLRNGVPIMSFILALKREEGGGRRVGWERSLENW